MKRLRIGVIGLGVGEQHVRAYMSHPECEITAVCDLFPEKLTAVQAKYPGAWITREADDLFRDPSIDVVSIASYDGTHFEQVLKALRAGKHVFVEKPLCQTLDQLRTIKQTWIEGGGKLKIGCNLVLRAAPLFKWLEGKIRTGDLGEVYAFEGEYLYGRLDKITKGWRKEVENYSVMQGGGIHLIDLMIWLTGQRPSAVSAMGNRICTAGTGFRYNDYVTAIMASQSGLVSRICANFGCVHRHQHVLRLYGTKGTFLYDDAGPRLHLTRDPAIGPGGVALATLPASKGDLIPGFVSSILSDEDTSMNMRVILDGLSVSIACDKSLKTRAVEEVEYV